jgi:hypothetical protein
MKHRRKITDPHFMMPTTVRKIFKIRMVTTPTIEKGGIYPNFQVICKGHIFYDYNKAEK